MTSASRLSALALLPASRILAMAAPKETTPPGTPEPRRKPKAAKHPPATLTASLRCTEKVGFTTYTRQLGVHFMQVTPKRPK